MRRVMKWVGIVLGVALGLVLVVAVVMYINGTSQLNRTSDIRAETITIPTDEESLERGAYLAAAICTECHSLNLAGSTPDDIFIDESGIVRIYAANLTPGEGGIGDLSDADLIRAIRHGVDQDDSHLIIMPAEIFINWSEEDLGSVIAYLRTLPPVDNVVPDPQVTVIGRIMVGAGLFGKVFPADYIDHVRPFPEMPAIGVNEAYGQYMASAFACTLCHGDNLAGGIKPENLPFVPTSPNLTGENLAEWTEDDFFQVLRTGVTPDGHQIDSEHMPWELYAKLSLDDLRAIWTYVQSLPTAESTG